MPDNDATPDYRLTRRQVIGLNLPIALFPVYAILLAFRDSYWPAFVSLTEGGPVELATFGAFLAASYLGLRNWRRARRCGAPRWVGTVHLALGVLAFVAAMEEISWGQSFLNYDTPWGLHNVNEQGELNIHNLPGVMDLNDVIVLSYGLAGLVGIGLGRVRRLHKVAIPPVILPYFVAITIGGGLLVLVYYVTITYSFDMIVAILSEVIELLMGLAALWYMWLNGRLLEPQPGTRARA